MLTECRVGFAESSVQCDSICTYVYVCIIYFYLQIIHIIRMYIRVDVRVYITSYTVHVHMHYILVILPLAHIRGPVGLDQNHWRQHPRPYIELTTRQCPQSSSLPTGRADEEKHQWCLQECSGRTAVSSRTRPCPPRYQGCVLYLQVGTCAGIDVRTCFSFEVF